MELPRRKLLPHTPPSWVRADEALFFITINCQPKGENQLCHKEVAAQLFESVIFRQQRGDWWVEVLLLMPDHLHALMAFPDAAAGMASPPYRGEGGDATPWRPRTMQSVITAWKHYAANKLGIRWQRDFFDHRLRHDESVRDKADYILQNPVRKGLVAQAEDWPYVWMAR